VFTVFLPAVLVGTYYSVTAADQFVAEVRMAVRTPDALRKDAGSLGIIGRLLSTRDSGRDVFVVSNYIRSRNIVGELDADGRLRRIFGRSEADFLSRFDPSGSPDELWKYWLGKVSSSVDIVAGIITVRATAFTRADALQLADDITRRAEVLVNDYSTRLRADAMRNAQKEVDEAAARYRKALLTLRDFRDADRVVDPIAAAVATETMLLQVRLERIAIEQERIVTASLTSPRAPGAQLLAERVKALDEQIARLRSQLTVEHGNMKAASITLAKFEELEIERLFAERLLTVAINAYEKARQQAERQQVYLAVFAPARTPEDAQYPRRLVNTALVFFCAFMLWAVARLIVASARDQML
jgi:capsular polysaccharide transport system permease protein